MKSYMTVQIEKPSTKLKRAVKNLGVMKKMLGKNPEGDMMKSLSLDEAIEEDRLDDYIEDGVSKWSFHVFEADALSKHGALVWVCEALVRKSDLMSKLSINRFYLRNWLLLVRGAYKSEESVPYHNSVHGADVCQTTFCLMDSLSKSSSGEKKITEAMKYVALLAACAHDVGHSGVNNNFLVNTNDDLAILYSYDAPLERMHASKGFALMREKNSDVFSIFDGEQLKKSRKWFMNFILSTDMGEHFAHVGQLKKQVSTVGVNLAAEKDAEFVLGMILHAADVSNPAKSWQYYNLWTDRVMKEFFAQGRKEKQLGMRVSDGYDENNPTPQSKFQNGFIAFIVKPLYEALNSVEGLDLSLPIRTLEDNSLHWKRDEAKKKASTAAAAGVEAAAAN